MPLSFSCEGLKKDRAVTATVHRDGSFSVQVDKATHLHVRGSISPDGDAGMDQDSTRGL